MEVSETLTGRGQEIGLEMLVLDLVGICIRIPSLGQGEALKVLNSR